MAIPAGAASGTSVDIPVSHKTIGASENGTVYVTLTPKSVRAEDGTIIPMPEGSRGKMATIEIKGDGRAAFENLVFDADGVYKYEIAQKQGTNTKISYDSTVYEVKVVVKNGKAHLTINKKNKGVKEDTSEVEFEDKPDQPNAPPVTISPKVKKTIDGSGTYANDTFKFTMTPSEDTEDLLGSSAVYKAKVKGEGTAKFSTILIDTPGEYVFTVKESQDHKMSWNYDETVYTYTAVVEEKDGELVVASTKIETAGKKVSEMKYKNVPGVTNRIYSNVKTGDPQQWMLLIVIVISGMLAMSFVVVPKKRRRNK